jgi:hypothetical protein
MMARVKHNVVVALTTAPEGELGETDVFVARGAHPDVGAVVVARRGDAPLPVAGTAYAGATVVRAYAVETVVHWDDGLRPGVTRLAFVAALPALSRDQFRIRYEAHAPIARVQHPGICRYVQHFVGDGTEPVCAAIAELHFADERAMRERFYRDADSPRVVDADIADYLDRDRTWSVVTSCVTA